MAQRAESAADVARNAVAFARAMTVGMRSWGFYPPEHPAVAMAVERLVATAADACAGGMMQLAVTPRALLIDGLTLESTDLAAAECAELLHDRDILQLTIAAPPPDAVVRSLLAMLTLDRQTRRGRGGPAAIWDTEDQAAILIEQIDYQEILERELDEGAARRDATWKSIVRAIVMGHATFTPAEQTRLLEISRDVGAIGELGKDAKEPFCMPDGSPMLTTQAAAVMAVYRHIAKTVTALEMLLQEEQTAAEGIPLVQALKKSFDDQQIALLLARALSQPGQAANRLAKVLDTLAPDEDRKKRVLTLARRLISERDFGSKRPIDDIRKSLDELMLQYDETTYVSTDYRESMDQAATRAADLSARGLPPEIDEWLETLGGDSVRRLSGQLLIDLLRNETVPSRMSETARDMGAFVEELLLAGVSVECLPVIEELLAAAARKPAIAPEACRRAVEAVGASKALAETTAAMGDQSAEEFSAFERLVAAIGPTTAPAILAAYTKEDGTTTERATALLSKLGPPVIPAITAGLEDKRWFVQRELAKALGRIGTSAAVPPLQTLLRRSDARVMQPAISAMAGIADPGAERALHTVLKAASGDARAAVISTLLGLKDPRIGPMLARLLPDADPFGADHPLLLEILTALSTLRDDRAVAHIAALARKKRWTAWGKMTAMRQACLAALSRIGSPKAKQAITDLAASGDFFLKRMARKAAGSA